MSLIITYIKEASLRGTLNPLPGSFQSLNLGTQLKQCDQKRTSYSASMMMVTSRKTIQAISLVECHNGLYRQIDRKLFITKLNAR